MNNMQEKLEEHLEHAQSIYDRGNEHAAWFVLACAAVRALIAIASFLWDFYSQTKQCVA
jgi:hypothetical protein